MVKRIVNSDENKTKNNLKLFWMEKASRLFEFSNSNRSKYHQKNHSDQMEYLHQDLYHGL